MVLATDRISPGSPAAPAHNGLAERLAFALIVAYAIFLATAFATGAWVKNLQGQTIQTDFVNVWAAGRLVVDGHPADVYDWPTHKAVEEAAVGHPFDKYFGWHYPPPFLFVAAALSLLPYLAAFAAWMLLTLPLYAAVIRGIVGRPPGFWLACAFPGVLWNVATGQNGFLSAALLGGTLLNLERRPLVSGILLGLLSYKPHFGLLFPLVLLANGYWRVFFTAALTALAMIGASWLAFGTETWRAFFDLLPLTGQLVLGGGLAGFQKLQTVFGAVRLCGGDEFTAWCLHGAATAAAALGVLLLWRRRVAYEIKAAALATAALIATPYLYAYDLVALAVPMAFAIRLGLREGFFPGEVAALALASGLVLIAPVVDAPTGLAAVLLTALLVGRRAFATAALPAAATA